MSDEPVILLSYYCLILVLILNSRLSMIAVNQAPRGVRACMGGGVPVCVAGCHA
jgi:hypothetical protein